MEYKSLFARKPTSEVGSSFAMTMRAFTPGQKEQKNI